MKTPIDIRKFAKEHYPEVTNIFMLGNTIEDQGEYMFDGLQNYICIIPKSKMKDIVEWFKDKRDCGEYEIYDGAILYHTYGNNSVVGLGYKIVFEYALMVLNNEI